MANAATRYVRKTGNDSNSGSSASSAWQTLNKAFTTLAAGDVCYVGAGTYTEGTLTTTNSGTAANRIQLIADIGGANTGDAGTVYFNRNNTSGGTTGMYITKDYWTINSFKIYNAYDGVRINNATGTVLQNCEVYSLSLIHI